MVMKCPGSLAPRNLDSFLVPCPGCGKMLEMFTDEISYRCRCGQVLKREAIPQCSQWCPAAAQCTGKIVDAVEWERRFTALKNQARLPLPPGGGQPNPPEKKGGNESR